MDHAAATARGCAPTHGLNGHGWGRVEDLEAKAV